MLDTEPAACNLCGCLEQKPRYREHYRLRTWSADLRIVECRMCGLVYVSPRLTPASTAHVYSHDAARTISHNYCWEGTAERKRFRDLLQRLSSAAPQGRLLDVGCGGGHFLAEAAQLRRWELFGVDPSHEAARAAAELVGCPVLATTLEQADFEPASFDVIAMLGVLEHLHDPSATLARARKLLKPQGVLAVYVPNFNYLRVKDTGPLCLLTRGRWSDLHPQEHLFQYTPATLQALLNKAGFEVDSLEIGQPFLQGPRWKRTLKKAAYLAAWTTKKLTGLHCGGLEAVARCTGKMEQPTQPLRRVA